ncbi:hypothetical protein [Pseudomonas sp. 1928-m]|uniref:hypothetical protein n=1 Tax=Pseudomonas sp. 1928-m TaxID=3033804 RepID=UPI0023DE8D34|nr:hypothetical protein [Pseudomonas sp. 1928-m]MDF3197036.1 hypothetical protein [Pseudomonas sp. 1928-m]
MPAMAQYKIKLLNEFECRSDEWSFADFENRLRELRNGASYHDAKGIINGAHREGKWPNTVKRYLATNFKAHGNVSSEFNETFSQVLASMSSSERQSWGI